MLRFFCSFLRWSAEGPEVVQLSKKLWETNNRIPILVQALLNLM